MDNLKMEYECSIEGMILKAEELMKMPKKKLVEVSCESLINLFHTADKITTLKTQELADTLKFDKVKSVQLVCFRNPRKLGTCDSSGNIRINFKTFFEYDYEGVIGVIIHELCHTEQHNHSKKFWTLFEQSCKRIGVLPSEYDGWFIDYIEDSPFMFIGPWKRKYHPQKYSIIRNKICYPDYFLGQNIYTLKSV